MGETKHGGVPGLGAAGVTRGAVPKGAHHDGRPDRDEQRGPPEHRSDGLRTPPQDPAQGQGPHLYRGPR